MIRSSPSGKERKWILLLLLMGLCALALLIFIRRGGGEGNYAAITHDGKRVALIDLDRQQDAYLSMSDYGVDVPVHFEVQDHRIRFVDVDCPDKICEHYGFIRLATQTAVCMPNRVAISIVTQKTKSI